MHAMHEVPLWVKLTATIVMLIGFAIAWLGLHPRHLDPGARSPSSSAPVYRFLYNKWYFDELYHFLFVRPAFWLGRLFWKRGDEGIIDRFGPDGAAWVVAQGAVVAQAVPVGLPHQLRADHAARPGRRDHLGAVLMDGFPILSRHAAGAAARRGRLPVRGREGGAHDRARRDADRPRARHRAVGQLRHRRRAVAVHRARADLRRVLAGRSGSTASR